METKLFNEFKGENFHQWESAALKFLKGEPLSSLQFSNGGEWSANAIYHEYQAAEAIGCDARQKKLGAYLDLSLKNIKKMITAALNNGVEQLHFFNYQNHKGLIDVLEGVDLNLVAAKVYLIEELTDLKEIKGVSYLLDPFVQSFSKDGSTAFSQVNWSTSICSPALYPNVLREFGGSEVQELTYVLWGMEQYLLAGCKDEITVLSGIGADFLNELAKMRTFAVLVQNFNELNQSDLKLNIHAINVLKTWSTMDEETNLLRACSQLMSAYLSNINGVIAMPYNILTQSEDVAAQRWAHNMIWLFRKESFMDEVMDPAKGAYYIEEIGKQMLLQSWNLTAQLMEEHHPLTTLKEKVMSFNEKLEEQFNSGEAFLIGVHKYPGKKGETSPFVIFKALQELVDQRWAVAYEKGVGHES